MVCGRTLLTWADAALDQLEKVNRPLLVLALVACIQFIYFDVSLEIAMLPRLMVFVFVGGEPPPV